MHTRKALNITKHIFKITISSVQNLVLNLDRAYNINVVTPTTVMQE